LLDPLLSPLLLDPLLSLLLDSLLSLTLTLLSLEELFELLELDNEDELELSDTDELEELWELPDESDDKLLSEDNDDSELNNVLLSLDKLTLILLRLESLEELLADESDDRSSGDGDKSVYPSLAVTCSWAIPSASTLSTSGIV
jgi:hypothetical protein